METAWVIKVIEITPEMARLLFDILLMVGSAILGSYLTYVYAIKKILRERVLTERVSLYRPLVHSLSSLIDLSYKDPRRQEKVKQLETELNRLKRELLLYAPDHVFRSFMTTMKTVKKGAEFKPMLEFILFLRTELLRETDITLEEAFQTIELRP